ncbi:signal peptidase I [Thermofilum pendens]|uniref:Phage repressor n=1 Tax=Thermofilum pendens (strain DSM 2475 / Hrk 5) TaxID=368408 RepID=A1RYI4_THEPD|nr:signal peptidase I [Thermofilum pendens]ABL78264.1 putative phage repressor [Thermofilum pendens Hrk 5]
MKVQLSRELALDVAAIVGPAVVSSLAMLIPIENFLSKYPFGVQYAWYYPWRGMFVALLLWIFSGATYSEKRYFLKKVFLGSSAAFVTFHYSQLWVVSRYVRVQLMPLFYLVGEHSPFFLDMGLVVLILTLLAFRKEVSTPSSQERRSESRGVVVGGWREIVLYALTIVGLLVFLLSLRFVLSTPVPLAVVSSWSMEPVLHVGDVVVVAGGNSYTLGDIVIYERGGELIVHRIVLSVNGKYVTKGDANPQADNIVLGKDAIYGKVQIVIPYIGALKLIFYKG